ncbi:MAG: NAD(P)H-dependent oxidoreductase subunit E [Candidatus Omnitrophica bacterium]|nr:NAD(P)H-dependent oxidoreductase subunit E [Candidatus Omnitrophota bacterium]
MAQSKKKSMELSAAVLDRIIKEHEHTPGALLTILECAQQHNDYKYLPESALRHIAKKTKTPPAAVFSVATFYSFFNLQPQGEHTLTVCRGTACHTKGSKALLEELAAQLGGTAAFQEGQNSFTTGDKKFTIRTVACFGQCALAPVVAVDETIHSRVTVQKLKKLIRDVQRGGKKK